MAPIPLHPARPRLFDKGLTLAIGLAVLVFFSGLIGLGDNADRLAQQREETQAQNALQDKILEVAGQATANTEWDDAVVNVSNRYDPVWVVENIGFYYTQPSRYDFVYLIDKTDHPVFGMHAGKPLNLASFAPLSPTAAPLIASVRAAEARRGPFRSASTDSRVLSHPIEASDVARFDGRLYIVTTTLIQPEFGHGGLPLGPRSAIVLTGKPIDAAFLHSLGERLMLTDVHLAGPMEKAKAFIDLKDRDGTKLARIAWTPRHPGADLIALALLPILLGVGAPLVLYLNGRRTARRLAATLDELALARDEADAANAQKSEFLATMSHEIRTPLNGILAMAQVIARQDLAPELRQRLSVISHSGEALLTIVNDVLDLSKIEAGHLDLDPRPFDLADIALALKGLYDPVAQEKAIGLAIEIAREAEGLWRGDPDRIRQVVANLISNALKFTAQGRVVVRLTPAENGGVRIEVADTGIGIAADKAGLIFEKFRQADSSTARRFGGTGLGLSISRQLVEMMRGRIWVESQPGVGSTFFVEIPLPRVAEASSARVLTEAANDPRGGEIRVLAVDDNATNRTVLEAILDAPHFRLDLREDGGSALEAWRTNPYDLILMDIQMPVLDGVAATRLIRAEEAQAGRARTPIIALTANAMTYQLAEYRAAGMDECVSKPIRIADLHAAIFRLLSQGDPETDEAA